MPLLIGGDEALRHVQPGLVGGAVGERNSESIASRHQARAYDRATHAPCGVAVDSGRLALGDVGWEARLLNRQRGARVRHEGPGDESGVLQGKGSIQTAPGGIRGASGREERDGVGRRCECRRNHHDSKRDCDDCGQKESRVEPLVCQLRS